MEKSSLGRVCFVPIHPVSDCLFAVHENVMPYVTCDVMWCHLVSDNEIASGITWQDITWHYKWHHMTSITWHYKWCHMTLQVTSHDIRSDITWHYKWHHMTSDITWHSSDIPWHYKWHHITLQVASHDITSDMKSWSQDVTSLGRLQWGFWICRENRKCTTHFLRLPRENW